MVIKFEKFIESSGLELLWVLRLIGFSFLLQFFIFLFFYATEILFENANFKLNQGSFDNFVNILYIIFYIIFLYSIIVKKGLSLILKSLIRFFFFLTITNSLIMFSTSYVVPAKFKDWESFILVEKVGDKQDKKVGYIEKILNKIFK